jgi:two-component system, LuxR family, sensor kinase FixL
MNDNLSLATSEVLVRRLSRRYVLVLAAVAGLIGVDQALIQPMLVRMDGYAPVINLAGRQRMLSQRIVKAALVMQAAPDEQARSARREELRGSLDEWAAAHTALREGDAARGVLRVHTSEIEQQWRTLQPRFMAMQAGAAHILEARNPGDSAIYAASITSLVDNEPAFLATMERIVAFMEEEAARQLERVRLWALGIAAAIISLLVALGRFVVRPAVNAIRGKMDDLERHVALRTQELDATLASLRNEIAERERSEARSKSLAAQLTHADRVESMGRLAAGLAHELNQPLGAIANYSQACDVILSQPLGDEAWSQLQEFTRHIERASLRAGGIVRRIRNFVQPGAGNIAAVELTMLVREVIELCRAESQRAEVELLLQPCDREIEITVDPIQIQQVLVNLIQNAVQASMHAPPQRRRVTVRIATANEAVQVDVVDRGPGLADADPDALFTPFHTTKPDGLGVGLSICRSIIEQHRGTIWARSLPAHGAQFSFVLPLSEEHAVEPAARTDRICR